MSIRQSGDEKATAGDPPPAPGSRDKRGRVLEGGGGLTARLQARLRLQRELKDRRVRPRTGRESDRRRAG